MGLEWSGERGCVCVCIQVLGGLSFLWKGTGRVSSNSLEEKMAWPTDEGIALKIWHYSLAACKMYDMCAMQALKEGGIYKQVENDSQAPSQTCTKVKGTLFVLARAGGHRHCRTQY